VKAKVLAEYRQGYPLKEIAIRYGVPKATVSLWAAQAGIKRRSQGCRNKLRPEERDVQILEAVRAVVNGKPTLEEIGKRFPTRNGPMSRANVSRIYNTWKDWVPTKPFEPGDVVRFRGRDYEVVEPGVFEGKVRDQVTGQEVNIHWKEGDDIAVMIKQASTVTIVTTVEGQFPLNVLPPIVRQMVDEVADVATVPGVLPASQALGIVSAALGAGLAIPSDLDQQTFANLYMVSAAESGSGKSVTFKELMAPVYAYQEELRTRAQERRYGFKAELVRLKVTLKRAESGKEPITDEMLAGLIQRQDLVEAELKRKLKLVCEDVTPQKMQVLLAQNDERIFSASADARQVIQAVLPGNGDNPYLKAWSGDPVDVDRISRDAVPLKAPRMALLWLPQPDLLTEMFTKRVLTVNGFLPRVLPCVVEYAPMMLSNKTRRVAPKTKKNWNDLVRGLFETYHARKDGPLLLRREERVQTLLIDYYNSLVERRKGELADVGLLALCPQPPRPLGRAGVEARRGPPRRNLRSERSQRGRASPHRRGCHLVNGVFQRPTTGAIAADPHPSQDRGGGGSL